MTMTTSTTRFAWNEDIKVDKTEVRAQHIVELREACDDLDQRCDDHIGKGGTTRHPVVTDALEGFMSPQQKLLLQELDQQLDNHIGKGGTTRHPVVTDTVEGFMSPQQKLLLQNLDQQLGNHIGKGGLDKHPAATETSGGFITPEEKKMLNRMRSGDDTEHTFKAGMVMEWLGDINDPPAGWAVLDGKDGRPDSRGRYSIGAGGSLLTGALGGALDVPVPLPKHNHSAGGDGDLYVDMPGFSQKYYNWLPEVDPSKPKTRYNLLAGGPYYSYTTGGSNQGYTVNTPKSAGAKGVPFTDLYTWSAPIQGGSGEVYAGTEGATIRLLPPYIALVKIVKLPKATKV